MKLKFLIFVMVLAAMGPARKDAPPLLDRQAAENQPMSPEEARSAPETEAAPELQVISAVDSDPSEFLWSARPVVVFADTPDDPSFRQQLTSLRNNSDALIERDVVVITDSDPSANSAWRAQLHPRGFSLVIIDKDGQVKARKPMPWDVREISRTIDKFPLRRQEIGRAGVLP